LEMHRVFSHQFCAKMVTLYDDFVRVPHTAEEIAQVERLYRFCGLPGCIGSVDGVHVHWENCPVQLANWCKGKEGHPSLVYEVVCDH